MSSLLDRYKALHDGEGFYYFKGVLEPASPRLWDGSCFARKLFRLFNKVVSKRDNFRVLDYGCGKAEYMSYIHKAYAGRIQEWYCYDPGYNRYSTPPSGEFDYIICADLMEHVEDYEETLAKMETHLSKKGIAIFGIAGHPDSIEFDDGLNMHVTLKSAVEWQQLLKKHFGNKKVILVYNNTNYWESWHATL